MFTKAILATFVFGALTPAVAMAQQDCAQQARGHEVVGGLVGAGLGALIGHAIGGHAGGTIAGGLGGAVAGAAVGGSTSHCGQNQYGYYDQGRWVPNTVTASGYYGPDGGWVYGPAPGAAAAAYGNSNQSYANQSNQYGHYDGNGRWIPTTANANGYYGPDGQWVYGPAPGYGANAQTYGNNSGYGSTTQTYGQSPTYGQNSGYGANSGYEQNPGYGATPQTYGDASVGVGDQRDTQGREARIEARINQGLSDGSLGDTQGRRDLRRLRDIRRMDADYRSGDGQLGPQQYRDIDRRLDNLSQSVVAEVSSGPRPY